MARCGKSQMAQKEGGARVRSLKVRTRASEDSLSIVQSFTRRRGQDRSLHPEPLLQENCANLDDERTDHLAKGQATAGRSGLGIKVILWDY